MESVISELTMKNDSYACALAGQMIAESNETDQWYLYLDSFAALLEHPKALVRNRALWLLAANVQWDKENRFDAVLPEFLSHITDEKPITARQCIQALAQVGTAKPGYIPQILDALDKADFSKYRDSMRPLIEKDKEETVRTLTGIL